MTLCPRRYACSGMLISSLLPFLRGRNTTALPLFIKLVTERLRTLLSVAELDHLAELAILLLTTVSRPSNHSSEASQQQAKTAYGKG